MARHVFYWICGIGFAGAAIVSFFWAPAAMAFLFFVPYALLGIYDIHVQKPHNVLHNYPVIGHLRYMFEFVRPEIQQYFVATDQSGRPFNRETRKTVYERAKGLPDVLPFGTQRDIDRGGYVLAFHSLDPRQMPESAARIVVGGPACKRVYDASRLNISAMSYGSLSSNAVRALNAGAKIGEFAHNTGEGGLSEHHLSGGGDLIWQIGTAYFGCRSADGEFDAGVFEERSRLDVVRMIEVKLSQGAKPSHGGLLPAEKINDEIARIRGIPIGEDCDSPAAHPEFATPLGLLEFVDRLRTLSGGKPVGFKLCIGQRREFLGICKAMLETGLLPDFITVDGAEGGTGAAPIEFSNFLGVPSNEGIAFVHSALVGCGLRDRIRVIGSGKVAGGFDMLVKLALGADMCNSARAMMFSLGCIQSLRCHDNTCPTGVATQNVARAKALVVEDKKIRVARFHRATVKSFLSLAGALGADDPADLHPDVVFRRDPDGSYRSFVHIYPYLDPGDLLGGSIHPAYAEDWSKARSDRFAAEG